MPYAWHVTPPGGKDFGQAGYGTTAADPRRHPNVYSRAGLSALGSRDRRTGRPLVLLNDSCPPQGLGTARIDPARSDEAPGPPIGADRGCRPGERGYADRRQGRRGRPDYGSGEYRG